MPRTTDLNRPSNIFFVSEPITRKSKLTPLPDEDFVIANCEEFSGAFNQMEPILNNFSSCKPPQQYLRKLGPEEQAQGRAA